MKGSYGMGNSNEIFVVILGHTTNEQINADETIVKKYYPDATVVQAPQAMLYGQYRFADFIIANKIKELILCSNKKYVAMLEHAYVNSQCMQKPLMSLHEKICCSKPLLCHPMAGSADSFRESERFMVADDACFGEKQNVLKHVFN